MQMHCPCIYRARWSDPVEAEFDRFVLEFGKSYENETERAFRLQVFREVHPWPPPIKSHIT